MISTLRAAGCIVVLLFLLPVNVQADAPLGLGRAVSNTEIERWDIDVRPDGQGLPAGQGNAAGGARVYSQHCLSCHGEEGKGGINDQLVGRIPGDAFPFGSDPSKIKTIGNYWPYATTLFDYIRRAMPYSSPGILSNDQVYNVTAYLLYLNGIIDRNTSINADNLAAVLMPARDRFVIDDRSNSEAFLTKARRNKP